MHLYSCTICSRAMRSTRDCRSCMVCKKWFHVGCDNEAPSDSFSATYTCISCRKDSLVDGDAIMPCVATENATNFLSGGLESDDDEMEFAVRPKRSTRNSRRISPSPSNLFGHVGCSSSFSGQSSPTTATSGATNTGTNQFNSHIDDDLFPSVSNAGISSSHHQQGVGGNVDFLSGLSSPTATTGTTESGGSLRDESPIPTNVNNNSECGNSDTDEYKPRNLKKSESQGRTNRATAVHSKKKPANVSMSRQTSAMRTRSGGNPPATSYANLGYEDREEKSEQPTQHRGKRGGRSVNKGKSSGGGRGRRTGGRSSKFSSMSYLYASSSAAYASTSALREDRENADPSTSMEGKTAIKNQQQFCIGGGSSNSTDDHDYIRTAIVTNANDEFMNSVSLCLICGSVGKDAEATMLTCTSCAQSYHTFCVGMQDKLNSTILKRGWRCLDCTVCEGCGDGKDESNLLLCDECDVSFHTYCLDPPLEKIPHGSWRCKWCAMCCRCNKKVSSSVDLQRLEGFCETCYSLRKCLKCTKLYEVGDLLVKCQRCIRWFHAKCEDLMTEEQVENASENAFRCSFCRPQISSSYNDVINVSVIIDNVMVDKSAGEHIQSIQTSRRMNSMVYNSYADSFSRGQSCENDDFDVGDDFESGAITGGTVGRGGRGGGMVGFGSGRGVGPGRRMLKIGVGGFNVKLPRHRLMANSANAGDESSECFGGNAEEEPSLGYTLNGKPRIRRPRKPRRPQLEDAYPGAIQESFFGFAAVDSRSLADQVVDEPVLGEFKKSSLDSLGNKVGCELSEQSAEALRTEQEEDMLGEIDILGGGIDFDLDFDLSDIMNGADEDEEPNEENGAMEESLTDGFSAAGSSGVITGLCSPSTSGLGMNDAGTFGGADALEHGGFGHAGSSTPQTPSVVYKGDPSSMQQHHLQMQQDDQRKRLQQLQSRINMNGVAAQTAVGSGGSGNAVPAAVVQRSGSQHSEMGGTIDRNSLSASNQATERWEEDEPLGDKATKAAVLYSNLFHTDFKERYPVWSERVKHINRVWRMLDAANRQKFVDMARKNRANSGVTRKRTRRSQQLPTNHICAAMAPAGSSVVTPRLIDSGGGGDMNGQYEAESNIGETTAMGSGQHADPVTAHVAAIKQAQARALMQQQQRITSFQQKDVRVNGEEIFGGGTPENCVSSNDGSSQNNLSANAVCLKSSVQQNQIIRQEWSNGGGMTAQSNSAAYQQAQQKPVVSSAVLDTYQTLKSQFGELEREQQEHDVELLRMRKLKKNLSAKHRQLMKSQVVPENTVDSQQQPLSLNQEAMNAHRVAEEEMKRAILVRQKQLERCKQELKNATKMLNEFETKYALNSRNEQSMMLNGGSATPMMVVQQPPAAQMPAYSSCGAPAPTTSAATMNSFNVRQQQVSVIFQQAAPSAPSPSRTLVQQQNLQMSQISPNVTAGAAPPQQNNLADPMRLRLMSTDSQLSGVSQSAMSSSGSRSTIVSVVPPSSFAGEHPLVVPKPGRGRKRKKIQMEEFRSPSLGGTIFSLLQDQTEKDVYDTLDWLVNCVVMNSSPDNKRSYSSSAKRIFYNQNQSSLSAIGAGGGEGYLPTSSISGGGYATSHAGSYDGLEPPKMKKKRQQFKKQAVGSVANDSVNEYELMLERIQSQVDLYPFPKRSLEQFYALDKNILVTPTITTQPDRPGRTLINGCEFGDYSLSFMPNYYDRIETNKGVDESSLFPKSMAEICSGVNLNGLISYEDDDLVDDFITEEPKPDNDSTQSFLYQSPELEYLSFGALGERSQISSSCLMLGSTCLQNRHPPLEPHWSLFDKVNVEPAKEFKISLTIDSEALASKTVLMENLKRILNAKDLRNVEIETPPQSPIDNGSLIDEQTLLTRGRIKLEDVYEMDTANADDLHNGKNGKRCRNCEHQIAPVLTPPIEESMSRLGLTPPDDSDQKVSFCSMRCYYKFMLACKVPLSVELLNRAEKYVDEETIEKLRQISADSFAKRIHQSSSDQQQKFEIKTTFLTQSIQSPALDRTNGDQLPQKQQLDSDNLLELMRQPREQVIRACDLPAIVQSIESQNQAVKGEYKWRGHSWMVCDMSLLQSFQRNVDEKYASIQLKINEKNHISRSEDTRVCALCAEHGDGDQELTGRLLNVDANEWVHVNCALWSSEVHETDSGALLNVKAAIKRSALVPCLVCGKMGASLKCYKLECVNHAAGYHLSCAKRVNARFIRDRTFYCPEHEVRQEMRVYRLDSLRRIYVQREENQLLAKIFNHSYPTEMMMRVGSLIFCKIGQLLPDQLKSFHNEHHIFPIGYRVVRIFWSPSSPYERTRYECFIEDRQNRPEFCVMFESSRELRDSTPNGAWSRILHSVLQIREKAANMLKFFPNQISGEALFGLTEPAITKMTESLPGIEQLFTYTFKHGGTPLMDLPLAENPSGCARCEPCFRTLIKHRYRPLISLSPKKQQPLTQSNSFSAEVIPREARSTRSASTRFQSVSSRLDQETLRAYKASGISEEMLTAPYLRFDLGGSSNNHQVFSQYRRMQKEWPNNVYLARSKIQGLGLYAKRDIDMNAMIIEYKGEVIRSEVGEMREKKYISQNRGVYMFRIDDELLIDATLAGGLARYINHSCDPNCSTKILPYNDDKKIIIIANRPIKAGEELTYDYQFELEDTTDKIPCLCGAPNCNKWMN